MAKLTNENKLLLAGLLATAIGTAVFVAVDADHPKGATVVLNDAGVLVPPPDAMMRKKHPPLDVEAYHAAVKQVRETDPTMVDLLTAEVEPGAEVTAEVTIPAGARAFDVVPVGPAQDTFAVLDVAHVDAPEGTRVTVRAQNNGPEAERFVAMFHWNVPTKEVP